MGKSQAQLCIPCIVVFFWCGITLFSEHYKFVASMSIALGVLELIHIRFRRAWWLARQMWGKSAGCEVKLNINEDGVQTQNPYTKTVLLWADIKRVIETDLGLILVAKSGGQQYLSKALFSAELIGDIVARVDG
jgi:hypothetical protein